MSAKITTEEYKKDIYNSNPNLIVVGEYTGAHNEIHVKCNKCNMYWDELATSLKRNPKCPFCAGKRPIPGKNDLGTRRPDLAREWNYACNKGKKPEDYLEFSNEPVSWICKLGHEWVAQIDNRTRQKSGCPVCGGKIVLKGFNDLQSQKPEIAEEWDYEKNESGPDAEYCKSHNKVGWVCPLGHKWETKVYLRTVNGTGCPVCDKTGTSFAEQAVYYYLKKQYPDAQNGFLLCGKEFDIFIPSISTAVEYDGAWAHGKKGKIERDNKKDQFCITKGIRLIRIREEGLPSTNSAETIVRKNGDNYLSLDESIKQLFVTLYCNGQNIDVYRDRIEIRKKYYLYVKNNSLATIAPELVKEWHPTKNLPLTPSIVPKGYHDKVYWQCKKYPDHVYDSTISHRINDRQGCPYCSNQRLLKGFNDLETIDKELAKEWSPNNTKKPSDVFPNSHDLYNWICNRNHEYPASPANRRKGKGCPYCSGRKAFPGETDLKTLYPEIAAEWDYENNNTPITTVRPGSETEYSWICPKGHHYYLAVNKRVRGQGCTYCNGHGVITGENDFAHVRPDLVQQWDYEKNTGIDPEKIRPQSGKSVGWKCKKCGYTWDAKISNRYKSKYARCKKCKDIITA